MMSVFSGDCYHCGIAYDFSLEMFSGSLGCRDVGDAASDFCVFLKG